MTNAFAYPCQKILKKHSDDEEIALILKDIGNAQQGVMTFSKEVKKYMLQFIHARYDDNQEVNALIDVLKNWSKYESFSYLEIFKLQDECYFGTTFFMLTARGKSLVKPMGFKTKTTRSTCLFALSSLTRASSSNIPSCKAEYERKKSVVWQQREYTTDTGIECAKE